MHDTAFHVQIVDGGADSEAQLRGHRIAAHRFRSAIVLDRPPCPVMPPTEDWRAPTWSSVVAVTQNVVEICDGGFVCCRRPVLCSVDECAEEPLFAR